MSKPAVELQALTRGRLAKLALLVFGPTIVFAASPPQEIDIEFHTDAMALVNQLGDDDYFVRVRSTNRLIELGVPATKALRQGRKSFDREIRFRSEHILEIILERDFQRRLEAFAAGGAVRTGTALAGWDRWQSLAGESQESREFFVRVFRAEPELMQSAEDRPKIVRQRLEERRQEVGQSRQLSVESVAAILLLATDKRIGLTRQLETWVSTTCYQPAVRDQVSSGPAKEHLRTLLGAWLRRPDDKWTSYQKLSLSLQYDLDEGLVAATKILEDSTKQAHVRRVAVLVVTKYGNAEHIPLLENLLSDSKVISSNQTFQIQLRDVALAALVHLVGEDPQHFGFVGLQPNARTTFNTNQFRFASNRHREAAIQRWHNYRADTDLRNAKQDVVERPKDPRLPLVFRPVDGVNEIRSLVDMREQEQANRFRRIVVP